MDTPLPAAIHEEDVHISGGKTTVRMKPDKLKTAGKERKALADLGSNYILAASASKDVDLKQKSAMKVDEIKKNQMKVTRNTPSDHVLTEEEIKHCYEWAKDGIEEMGGYSWSVEEERKLL